MIIPSLNEDSPLISLARLSKNTVAALMADNGFEARKTTVTPEGQHDYYEWYYAYGKILQPKTVLEIGVFGGGSMFALCAGAGDCVERVDLVDDESDQRPLGEAAGRVRRTAKNVIEHVQDSQRVARLKDVVGEGPFDVISVDGDHRVGPCYHDLRIALPLLAEDGHIIVDDGNWPWVKQACEDFLDDSRTLDAFHVNTFTGTIVMHRAGAEHAGCCPLIGVSP